MSRRTQQPDESYEFVKFGFESKIRIKLFMSRVAKRQLDLRRLSKNNSLLFETLHEIGDFHISQNICDPSHCVDDDWLCRELGGYNIENYTNGKSANFVIIILDTKLNHGWFERRPMRNVHVISIYRVKYILKTNNIRIENLILVAMYRHALTYLKHNGRLPSQKTREVITHFETRGCIFDFNGEWTDIIYVCSKPIICEQCLAELKNYISPGHVIEKIHNEIRSTINKDLIYVMIDFIKVHPLVSIAISTAFAFSIGVVSSFVANLLIIKPHIF